jgi:hypothetical protein
MIINVLVILLHRPAVALGVDASSKIAQCLEIPADSLRPGASDLIRDLWDLDCTTRSLK